MAKKLFEFISVAFAAVAILLPIPVGKTAPVREPDEHSVHLGIGGKR